MSDLISRAEAIDATWFEPSYTDPLNVLTEVRDRLKVLPPAQPSSSCTHENDQDLQQTCNKLATDCISRQAAIDALHMHLMYRMGTDSNKKRLDEWINNLPSAQQEIVRCKDCKHYRTIGAFGTTLRKKDYWCDAENFPDEGQKELPEWWFCAGAERREEE